MPKASEGGGEESPSNNLWIGNLTVDTNDSDLLDLFGKYGAVDSVTNYATTRNYAFIYYKRLDDARAAKDSLQNALLRGNSIRIEFATPAPAVFPPPPNGDVQMFPFMYPALVPGLIPLQNQEQSNRGAGIYAVPTIPFMGPMSGIPTNTLIPLTYSIPTRTATAVSGEHGQEGRQQIAPQRQVVVRRFHFAFHIDLLLILKLAAVIFVFNQDGSRQRLVLLLFFASFVYLYQTGALTPLVRWLSQGMHRAAAPPQPRPPVRAENAPGEGDNAEGQAGAENVNQAENGGNPPVENENQAEPVGGNNGVNWRIIVKEIQMIVVGFITSLLPGFHNVD